MKKIRTPISEDVAKNLKVGDLILISGKIYCGRDAVLPKICEMIESGELDKMEIFLRGSVIFHTAVSPIFPLPRCIFTPALEHSFGPLSKAGVKIHLGKGKIGDDTIKILEEENSVYAVIPPVTALLGNNTIEQKLVAFPELGMEAFYELTVEDYPAIVAAAHNNSVY